MGCPTALALSFYVHRKQTFSDWGEPAPVPSSATGFPFLHRRGQSAADAGEFPAALPPDFNLSVGPVDLDPQFVRDGLTPFTVPARAQPSLA